MQKGFIVRSKQNPHLILCTNGEFLWEYHCGPGHEVGAKIYKTESRAKKVRGGEVIVEPYGQGE